LCPSRERARPHARSALAASPSPSSPRPFAASRPTTSSPGTTSSLASSSPIEPFTPLQGILHPNAAASPSTGGSTASGGDGVASRAAPAAGAAPVPCAPLHDLEHLCSVLYRRAESLWDQGTLLGKGGEGEVRRVAIDGAPYALKRSTRRNFESLLPRKLGGRPSALLQLPLADTTDVSGECEPWDRGDWVLYALRAGDLSAAAAGAAADQAAARAAARAPSPRRPQPAGAGAPEPGPCVREALLRAESLWDVGPAMAARAAAAAPPPPHEAKASGPGGGRGFFARIGAAFGRAIGPRASARDARRAARREAPAAPALDVRGTFRPLAAECVECVACLHEARVSHAHRDVKDPNFLVGFDGRLALGDLSLARPASCHALDGCGTLLYMAPEQAPRPGLVGAAAFRLRVFWAERVLQPRGRIDGRPVDVWALGVTWLRMLAGDRYLLAHFADIHAGRWAPPPCLGPELGDLLARMLSRRPGRRPAVAQIRAHPFFAGTDWPAVREGRAPPARGLAGAAERGRPLAEAADAAVADLAAEMAADAAPPRPWWRWP
jgi:hypothetical protein